MIAEKTRQDCAGRDIELDGPNVPTDACHRCGGPLRHDLTRATPPNYVGSAGVCWDCHLEATEGAGMGAFRAASVRSLVSGRRGAEALCREEAMQGLDDDLSGGCYMEIL